MIKWRTAWESFSLYIRERDSWKCVQCGKSRDQGYIMQAGHVIANGNGHSIRFFEPDVFCQCKHCNQNHSYCNLEYFEWYSARHKYENLDKINILRKQSAILWVDWDKSFSKGDFQSIKDYYDEKLIKLSFLDV